MLPSSSSSASSWLLPSSPMSLPLRVACLWPRVRSIMHDDDGGGDIHSRGCARTTPSSPSCRVPVPSAPPCPAPSGQTLLLLAASCLRPRIRGTRQEGGGGDVSEIEHDDGSAVCTLDFGMRRLATHVKAARTLYGHGSGLGGRTWRGTTGFGVLGLIRHGSVGQDLVWP